jgi:ribonuclease HI
VIYTDGAARGNPGPAGAGVCIRDAAGRVLVERGRYLGEATNNVAEYRALLIGLEEARRLGSPEVQVRSDSELLVRQMRGVYRVRSAPLQELHARAKALEREFERVEYVHVTREHNRDADRLANRAIDSHEPSSDGAADAS